MHLIIIQFQRQSPLVFGRFQVSICLVQSIFSIGRPLNDDTRINASNVSSFNPLMRSLFTQLCLENPRSHIVVLVKPKLQSRNYKSYWNMEVSARVPRLESNYDFIYKLQALYFVTSSFWRGLHCEGCKLCRAHFLEVPQKQKKLII